MGQKTLAKNADCRLQTKIFSLGMLGIGSLIGMMAFASPAKSATLCDAYALTLSQAKSFFESRCKVKYTPSKGHYCNKTSAGK